MNTFTSKLFIDSSTFMGMHSKDIHIRQRSVLFMSRVFSKAVYMNFEQIGICDDCIWSYPRHLQDKYYPFMDALHTEMNIIRIGYSRRDIRLVMEDHRFISSGLSIQKSLLIAQAINENGTLFTHDIELHSLRWLSEHLGNFDAAIGSKTNGNHLFTQDLDSLYLNSLHLQIDSAVPQEKVS